MRHTATREHERGSGDYVIVVISLILGLGIFMMLQPKIQKRTDAAAALSNTSTTLVAAVGVKPDGSLGYSDRIQDILDTTVMTVEGGPHPSATDYTPEVCVRVVERTGPGIMSEKAARNNSPPGCDWTKANAETERLYANGFRSYGDSMAAIQFYSPKFDDARVNVLMPDVKSAESSTQVALVTGNPAANPCTTAANCAPVVGSGQGGGSGGGGSGGSGGGTGSGGGQGSSGTSGSSTQGTQVDPDPTGSGGSHEPGGSTVGQHDPIGVGEEAGSHGTGGSSTGQHQQNQQTHQGEHNAGRHGDDDHGFLE